MKTHKPSSIKDPPKRKDMDVLDHIEEFIEKHIENKLKKGLDEVEKFLKKDLLEKNKPKGEREEEDKFLAYLDTFLKDRKVAAIMPSSKFILERVLKRIDWKHTKVVVEYGAAAGVLTHRLLEKLPADGTLVAVELNVDLYEQLRKIQDPRLKTINGSVIEIDKLLAPMNLGPVDAITSGIPFSFLKPLQRHELLHKTVDLLRPGGAFAAYQVTTHLVPLMKYHFTETDIDFEIRNLPPHFIFSGIK